MDTVLGILSTVAYVLAAVCAVVCVVLFFKLEVREAIRFLQHKPSKASESNRWNFARPRPGSGKGRSGSSGRISVSDDRTTGKQQSASNIPESEQSTGLVLDDGESRTETLEFEQSTLMEAAVQTQLPANSPVVAAAGSSTFSVAKEQEVTADSESETGLLISEGESVTGLLTADSESETGLLTADTESETGLLTADTESETGLLAADTESETGLLSTQTASDTDSTQEEFTFDSEAETGILNADSENETGILSTETEAETGILTDQVSQPIATSLDSAYEVAAANQVAQQAITVDVTTQISDTESTSPTSQADALSFDEQTSTGVITGDSMSEEAVAVEEDEQFVFKIKQHELIVEVDVEIE